MLGLPVNAPALLRVYGRVNYTFDCKFLRIKISDKSLTQRFDVSMTSLSSEKIKYRLVNRYKMRC